ncbi:MAG TPA: hypothetical protein GXZ45_07070 [Propionibacterium sp.]|nr:hypothetical protein [Propionibacterium sp.]
MTEKKADPRINPDELDEDLDNTNPRERRGDGGHPVNPPDGEGDQPGPGEDA